MIMYISKSKIDNLYEEAIINESTFSRFIRTLSIKFNIINAEMSRDFRKIDEENYLSKYLLIKKYIKKKKLLRDLNSIDYVVPIHYYYNCKGYIKYKGLAKRRNTDEGTIVIYKMKLRLQKYNKLILELSRENLHLLHNMGKGVFVDMIFIVKCIKDRTIIATPLIMYYD